MTMLRPVQRRGFTLIELLVVISILALLMALTASAVFRLSGSAQVDATQKILRKLDSGLDQQVKAVRDDIEKEVEAGKAASFFPNLPIDQRKTEYKKARMQQEFPTNFNEVLNPVPCGNGFLQPKQAYVRVVQPIAASVPAQDQGAICLYLALTQGRRGMVFPIEQAVGASAIRSISGVNAVVDVWGTPLAYTRGASGIQPYIVSAGSDKTWGTGDDLSSEKLRETGARGD
jgi:prepilin-type N-terminal cleavage/methylation domain-containing protein